jgi:hypothetical protein
MKIEIALNKKSINDAIKTIKRQRKILLDKMLPDYINIAAHWITQRANEYIDRADLGSIVKMQIKGGWEYVKIPNGLKIVNRTQKAVFVEFGVGIVGQGDAHPQASVEGYEYNVDSYHKDRKGTGTWVFQSSIDELDLPLKNVEFAYNESGSEYAIVTRGAKGVWYAYNAIVDAQMELAKLGGGEIGKMWEDIKARYIK